MTSPDHQALAAVPTPALGFGAAAQATTSQNQTHNTTVDEAEGASGVTQDPTMEQEIAQPAVATSAHPVEGASVGDTAPSPTNYIQNELPAEILLIIMTKIPDFDSLASTLMTCKKMYEVFLQHQKKTQRLLLQHNGQGFLGRSEATVALRFPVIDRVAVRNINDLIKAMRVFWGRHAGVSDIASPHLDIVASIRQALGLSPEAPTTALFQDLQMLRRESTSHLLFAAPSSAQVGDNAPAFQTVQTSWYIDRAASAFTLGQAREMAELGVCVESLCTAYLDSYGVPSYIYTPSLHTMESIMDRLWRFETFCRVFGGSRWWKRWQNSMHFPALISAFDERGVREVLGFKLVYEFLFHSVLDKWRAVTAGTPQCRCPGGPPGRRAFGPRICSRCCSRGVDGALCRGLAAVCRIVETPVEDVRALKTCFVWEEDGLPREHPFFLSYFFGFRKQL